MYPTMATAHQPSLPEAVTHQRIRSGVSKTIERPIVSRQVDRGRTIRLG
jgi:hypothetical protein